MSHPRTPSILRLGTRGSLLARTQSQLVADELTRLHPGLKVELVIHTTSGDTILDQPLHLAGGKGLFTKELEQALLAGSIDFAVHSLKDVPVTMPLVDQADLVIAAIPPREDPRDLLVASAPKRLADLPAGARVATGSLRRRCQILARWPHLHVEGIRGNIDTRLRKQREGQFDAVVLAMAGVRRGGLFDPAKMLPIELEEMLPAAGQGALALQCRRGDRATWQLLQAMNDPATSVSVAAEREVVAGLHGDCHSPIAALGTVKDGQLTLRAAVGSRDGQPPVIAARATTALNEAPRAVDAVLTDLLARGAAAMLSGA